MGGLLPTDIMKTKSYRVYLGALIALIQCPITCSVLTCWDGGVVAGWGGGGGDANGVGMGGENSVPGWWLALSDQTAVVLTRVAAAVAVAAALRASGLCQFRRRCNGHVRQCSHHPAARLASAGCYQQNKLEAKLTFIFDVSRVCMCVCVCVCVCVC